MATIKIYTTTEKMTRKQITQFDRAGFTFLEMTLVVVLAGLIASAAGGIYIGTYKRMLVKKSAIDFLLAAKYARITAIERQCLCRIKPDVSAGSFVMVVEEKGTSEQVGEIAVRDLYFKPMQFKGEVKFENIKIRPAEGGRANESENQNMITFFSNGRADNAVIQIGDGQNHFTVKVSAITGRAEICEGTADDITSDTVDLDEAKI